MQTKMAIPFISDDIEAAVAVVFGTMLVDVSLI